MAPLDFVVEHAKQKHVEREFMPGNDPEDESHAQLWSLTGSMEERPQVAEHAAMAAATVPQVASRWTE